MPVHEAVHNDRVKDGRSPVDSPPFSSERGVDLLWSENVKSVGELGSKQRRRHRRAERPVGGSFPGLGVGKFGNAFGTPAPDVLGVEALYLGLASPDCKAEGDEGATAPSPYIRG